MNVTHVEERYLDFFVKAWFKKPQAIKVEKNVLTMRLQSILNF